jgi:flavin-dependent dehydrogenase
MKGAVIDFAGELVEVRTRGTVAHVCDRAALDEALADNAGREGAKIEFGKRITGNYAANRIIGADGPLSSVASNFKFPKIKEFASTIQAHLKYKSETPDMVEVFLSDERFPGFFGWVIPHNEEDAEFGIGVTLPNNAGRAWKALLKLKGKDYSGKIDGAVIPLAARKKTADNFGNQKVLLVGDAAGQVKATTGGGVVFGANCAKIAGANCDSPHKYELEWRAKFGLDLFMHRQVHKYLAGKNEEQMRRLGSKIKRMDLDKYLSNFGHMDKPSKMIRPELIGHFLRGMI